MIYIMLDHVVRQYTEETGGLGVTCYIEKIVYKKIKNVCVKKIILRAVRLVFFFDNRSPVPPNIRRSGI